MGKIFNEKTLLSKQKSSEIISIEPADLVPAPVTSTGPIKLS